MSYTIFQEPDIGEQPILFAAWPGVGNAGQQAVEYLIKKLQATPFAELNSQDYYYPTSTVIEDNVLKEMTFPKAVFYFKKCNNKSFIFFVSDQQLPINPETSAEDNISYKMASDILELVKHFGCRRIYTAGASFSLIHHSMESELMYGTDNHFFSAELSSILGHKFKPLNNIFNSDFVGGMNGILPMVAIDKNMEAGILLGNIPIYLQTIPIPYPKATKTIVNAFAKIHKIDIDFKELDEAIEKLDKKINEIMGKVSSSIPSEIRKNIFSEINKLNKQKKGNTKRTKTNTKNLTINDVKNAITEIEEFFKKENSDEL